MAAPQPTLDDILIAALTVYGEARGCTQAGREAVAYSIVNRAAARGWWGRTVRPHADHSLAAVCLKPLQFSCWNDSDPNVKILRSYSDDLASAMRDKAFRGCLAAALFALDGLVVDQTKGATHYLTCALHETARAPAWAKNRQDYIEIDGHRFFSNVK